MTIYHKLFFKDLGVFSLAFCSQDLYVYEQDEPSYSMNIFLSSPLYRRFREVVIFAKNNAVIHGHILSYFVSVSDVRMHNQTTMVGPTLGQPL